MKTVNVKARITYDYEVEIPDDEEGCAPTDLVTYCDSFDPVYFAMCTLMNTKGVQWEGELISIVDENTDKVLWDGQ